MSKILLKIETLHSGRPGSDIKKPEVESLTVSSGQSFLVKSERHRIKHKILVKQLTDNEFEFSSSDTLVVKIENKNKQTGMPSALQKSSWQMVISKDQILRLTETSISDAGVHWRISVER